MKHNSKRTIIKMGIFIGVIVTVAFLVGALILQSRITTFQEDQANTAFNSVRTAMETSQESTDTIEHMIEQRLYTSSKGIMTDLRGLSIDEIQQEELREIADEWDVKEISLWERDENDITVTQSTDDSQIDLSARDWGYWYQAFDQLMSGETVTIDEGYARENFWVGPISQAELFEGLYYKFAYYYDGTTDYMVNAYIEDEDIYRMTFEAGPSEIISHLQANYDVIEEIAVVNGPAWLAGDDHEVIEPATDIPVLYGHLTLDVTEDEPNVEAAMEEDTQQSFDFEHEGASYRKLYQPMDQDRVMVMALNLDSEKQFTARFLWLYIVTGVLTILLVLFALRSAAKKMK
ncbi:hypothetical protein [Alkalibacillus salilacus]|uniref:Cache domain-containing protein n=1 Tax=Alkalibacillus salilacus TaxID=284582 RepID=A0ABT9VBD4_9BACI|nr:hypothetical protein [Alkalibacillus salilacus]MDQ0158251.1 hypothetical protein [Alkalibacillus salilacus]